MNAEIKKLIVYGTRNSIIVKLIEAINRSHKQYDLLGFIQDDPDTPFKKILGVPVLGGPELLPDLARQPDVFFFCNINLTNQKKTTADNLINSLGGRLISLVHPAIDINYAECGPNCMLCEGTIVGSGVKIGRYLTCRLGSIISHDARIHDYVYISPGVTVCGMSILKTGSDLGAGCTILPYLTVGKNAIVGAGAVVTKDVPDNVTVVGVPAKIIKHHDITASTEEGHYI
jgi:sugar O-acyltransferase (sialic acid O-acetyltransferase NeuD family)